MSNLFFPWARVPASGFTDEKKKVQTEDFKEL